MDLDDVDKRAESLRLAAKTASAYLQNDLIVVGCAVKDLIALVRGLREMLYGDVGYDGEECIGVWNPDMHVDGRELVEWAKEEMGRLDLIPKPGPR